LGNAHFTNLELYAIGDRRVQKIAKEYSEIGHLVIVNPSNHEGVDLVIISSPLGKILKVIESTNYAKTSYICKESFERYLGTLGYFKDLEDVQKELIVSFRNNLNTRQWNMCTENNIKVVVVGHQD
jgi:hypothetical protein